MSRILHAIPATDQWVDQGLSQSIMDNQWYEINRSTINGRLIGRARVGWKQESIEDKYVLALLCLCSSSVRILPSWTSIGPFKVLWWIVWYRNTAKCWGFHHNSPRKQGWRHRNTAEPYTSPMLVCGLKIVKYICSDVDIWNWYLSCFLKDNVSSDLTMSQVITCDWIFPLLIPTIHS